jgi:hypothetical protein
MLGLRDDGIIQENTPGAGFQRKPKIWLPEGGGAS